MYKPRTKSRCAVCFFAAAVLLFITIACARSEAKADPNTATTNSTAVPSKLNSLLRAYPAMIRSVRAASVEMIDGQVFDYIARSADFQTMLDETTLYDQLLLDYPSGKPTPPVFNHDPGRFRYDPFFKAMYGTDKSAIMKNLVAITWMPGVDGTHIQVTRINGVDRHLQNVSEKLLLLPPHIRNFARKPATFNWRVIEDTDRLSAHSFGIAIDIGVAQSHYWLWDKKKGFYRWVDDFPYEIVEIFESEGFIWGGRWYHYDTMHFEYRPELLPVR